jgi:hypothetical protein
MFSLLTSYLFLPIFYPLLPHPNSQSSFCSFSLPILLSSSIPRILVGTYIYLFIFSSNQESDPECFIGWECRVV